MKKTLRIWAIFLALFCILPSFFAFFLSPAQAEPSEDPASLPSASPEASPEESPSSSPEEDPDPTPDPFSSVLLYHNESGTVLYEKKTGTGTVPAGPAPRMVAALLFLEHYGQDLEATVTVNRLVTGLASSTMNPGLKSGEQISVYDLLCAMLIANSDDAVYALAFDLFENDSSAPTLLLDALNEKAQALGMKDTVFFNITGGDPKSEDQSSNYSTLSDLLTLALAFEEQKALTDICAIDDITLDATNKSGKRRLLTRNYLLSAKRIGGYTYKYATGLACASGFLSGHHAIVTAKIGSKTFTCISVGAMGLSADGSGEKQDSYASFTDAKELFIWADGHFGYKRVLDPTRVLGEIKVSLSDDSDYVTVVPEEGLSAFLPIDTDLEKEIVLETDLEFTRLAAPVYEGLIVGRVTVFYGERELGSVRLLTGGSLPMSNSMFYLSTLEKVAKTPLFLAVMGGVALLMLGCVFIGARIRYLRQNRPEELEYVEEEGQGTVEPLQGASVSDALKLLTGQTVALGKRALSARKNRKSALKQPSAQQDRPANEGQAAGGNGAEAAVVPLKKSENAGQSVKKNPAPQKPAVKVTGAKRMPGDDPRDQARRSAKEEADREKRQGGYVPSGWGDRKDGEDQ